MNDRVSRAVNTLAVLDEYKNDLDIRKIAYLKGLWGGGGQTKKNTNTDGMAAQTIVTTRCCPLRRGQAYSGYGTLYPCHFPCLFKDIIQPE